MATPKHVLDLIDKAFEEQAEFLDLGKAALTEVPEEITRLAPFLKGLNLGEVYRIDEEPQHSKGKNSPNKLRHGSNLSILDKLTLLTELHLWNCNIGDEGAEILSRLSGLHTLNIGNNNIGYKGVESLSILKGLHCLYIYQNQIGDEGAKSISQLRALHSLYISNCQIGAQGAESLSLLSGLHTLNISRNKIGDEGGKSLSRLSALHTLDISGNQIGAQGAESLSRLIALHTLKIRNNQIGAMGVESLSRLSALHTLDVAENQIKSLDWLISMPNLKTARLYGNPLEEVYQIKLKGYDNNLPEIAHILARLREKDKIKIQLPAKVLQLGNHAAGKSSFLHYLQTERLEKQDSTHLLKVEAYTMAENKKKGKKNVLPDAIFYDFGGQDYYHGLYRAFITPGALTLLFVDADNNVNQSRPDSGNIQTFDFNHNYWLEQKQHQERERPVSGSPDPVLLIETRADQHNRPADFDLSQYPEVLNRFFISLHPDGNNDKNQAALAYLKTHLHSLILERKIQREEPKWYEGFLNYLIREEAKDNHEATDIKEVLKEYKLSKESQRLENLKKELEQFCQQGMILYYKEIAPDKVWLSPEALIRHVHNHVLQKGDTDLKGGRVPVSVFEKKKVSLEILSILEEQKVIFRHQYTDHNEQEYILPNFLPLAETEQADFDLFTFGLANPAFVLRFQYFLPIGLINQMICFFGKQPDRKKFWRNQLLFTLEQKMKVLIQLDFTQLEIKCYTSSKSGHEEETERLKEYLFYCIIGLYWGGEVLSYGNYQKHKSSRFSMEILNNENLYSTENYGNPMDLFLSTDGKNFVAYKSLSNPIEDTRIAAHPKIDGKLVMDQTKSISIAPFQIFTPQPLKTMKKVMISYSKDDLAQVHRFRDALIPLVDAGLIGTPWYCTLLEAGSDWQEEIQTHLREADIVFFMCSISFIRTEYIREQEIMVAKAQQKDNPKKRLIPIILNYCEWEADLGEYTALPYTTKPVASFAPNTDIAWYLCTKAIRNMLTNSTYDDPAELSKMVKILYEEIVGEGK